ncbi:MAG: methylated-DNA--[protein]-cysteine S-methyltransferase [Acidimicrobiales bacterium]
MRTPRDATRHATATIDTPVGRLHVLATSEGLSALLWPDLDAELERIRVSPEQLDDRRPAMAGDVERQLEQYFAGARTEFDLPLDPHGTDFQLTVWAALREIPFGLTSSYGQQARAINRPRAIRAVAAANGRNPISIIVPCHRVIGADGSLTGFAGGLDTKAWLLEHERRR